MQRVAAGVGPGDDDAVAGMADDQIGQARRLHHVDERPETAGDGITATAHCAAGVRLADGAGDLIRRAGARAAATSDFIPVNGVLLGKQNNWGEEQQSQKRP